MQERQKHLIVSVYLKQRIVFDMIAMRYERNCHGNKRNPSGGKHRSWRIRSIWTKWSSRIALKSWIECSAEGIGIDGNANGPDRRAGSDTVLSPSPAPPAPGDFIEMLFTVERKEMNRQKVPTRRRAARGRKATVEKSSQMLKGAKTVDILANDLGGVAGINQA